MKGDRYRRENPKKDCPACDFYYRGIRPPKPVRKPRNKKIKQLAGPAMEENVQNRKVAHNHLVWLNEPPQPFCLGCEEAAKKNAIPPTETPKPEIAKLVLGSRLGSGANKYAFALKDDPTKVALVSSFKVLKDEIEDLKVLANAGVPVPKIYELHDKFEANTFVGRHESAVLMERFVCGSRGDVESKLLVVLNSKSLDSVREIREKLLAAQLYIDDLQFLFREDGSMVVADPDKVAKIEFKGQQNTMRMGLALAIKKIELGVEYAQDFREGLAPAPTDVDSYSFWDAAERWAKDSAEPKALRAAAKDGIFTQTRELVYDEVFDDLDVAA